MTNVLRYDPQPIARVETAWHAPWMLIGCSQQGPSHYHHGVQNADSYKLGSHGSRAWLIIADGVGSRPLSYHGSRIATAVVERFLGESTNTPLGDDVLRQAFAAAHAAINAAARRDNRAPGDYATTLAAVALEGDTIAGAAIGDSGIALYASFGDDGNEDILTGFCSAIQSEEPHKTYVITDPQWEAHTAFNQTVSSQVKVILLATDGADNFYLDQPHAEPEPVWKPHVLNAFDAGIAALSTRNFFAFFSNFLQQYEPDNHDDRTLLVAYRVPEKHAPPAQKPR